MLGSGGKQAPSPTAVDRASHDRPATVGAAMVLHQLREPTVPTGLLEQGLCATNPNAHTGT